MWRSVGTIGTVQVPLFRDESMADKSPRNSMSKKSGKSLKEKRADKKSKSNGQVDPEIVSHVKKR
jgi:hypothetical protein